MLKSEHKGLLITILAAILFGLYPPTAQIAIRDGANSVFIIILSTFFRAFGLSLFCFLKKLKIRTTKSEFHIYLRGSIFQAISIFGILGSLAYLDAPVTIIINFTHSLFLLAYLIYKKEQTGDTITILTTIFAILGISLVINVWSVQNVPNLIGIILAFTSSLATASRVYVFGRQVKETHPAVVGSRIFILTSILSLLLLFYKPILLPNSVYGYLGAIASSTALMFASFGTFYGISLLGTFRYSLLVKLEPVFTAIFSYLILKETLLPIQYLGMAIVIISLVSYQIFKEKKPIKT